MPVIVEFHQSGVTALVSGDVTRRWMRLLADVDRRAKLKLSGDMVNVDTGNLRSSQQTPTVTASGGRIVGVAQNVAEYAMYVHEGTRAHDIHPRGKVLTGWQFDGRTVFTPIVKHPGTRGRPFLREALREAMAAVR